MDTLFCSSNGRAPVNRETRVRVPTKKMVLDHKSVRVRPAPLDLRLSLTRVKDPKLETVA